MDKDTHTQTYVQFRREMTINVLPVREFERYDITKLKEDLFISFRPSMPECAMLVYILIDL